MKIYSREVRCLFTIVWIVLQYNHHGDEELTPALFEETFGKVDGSHYYEKWTGYFNRNLWDMIAYFRSEKENGQKFCDMVARQVGLYQKNRS